MINTPVSAPVYQIYLRGDDNEGLRSKRAFSLCNENGKMLEGFYSLYFTFSMYRSKFKEGKRYGKQDGERFARCKLFESRI